MRQAGPVNRRIPSCVHIRLFISPDRPETIVWTKIRMRIVDSFIPPNRDGVFIWKNLIPPRRDLGICKRVPGQADWLACHMNKNIFYEILLNKAISRLGEPARLTGPACLHMNRHQVTGNLNLNPPHFQPFSFFSFMFFPRRNIRQNVYNNKK